MKTAEREAVVAIVTVGSKDTSAIKAESERGVFRVGATRPVAATDTGAAQGAIRPNVPATDKVSAR